MKRFKINTTFEEDEEERRQFFFDLTYSERLRYFFKLRKMVNFHKRIIRRVRYLSYTNRKMGFDIDDEFYQSFLISMQRHKVRYMLIVGIAINFHGVNRNTQDMDIWLAPTNQNRDLFYNVLRDRVIQKKRSKSTKVRILHKCLSAQ